MWVLDGCNCAIADARGCGAGWELGLAALPRSPGDDHCASLAQEKLNIQNSRYGFY